MPITLETFAAGDTNYISKFNGNFATIESLLNAIDELLAGQVTAAIGGVGSAYSALFGPSNALIGSGSYATSTAGTQLTTAAGFVWKPADSSVVSAAAAVAIEFAGQPAATYYIVVDATGAPSRSTLSTDALHSVVWTGATFGTITRLLPIVWGAAEWTLSQVSAALGASYTSLDARLEAGEALAVAANAVTTDPAVAALTPLTPANNKIVRYTGATTAGLLDFDTDVGLAANSDTTIASQKAVKAYVDAIATSGASDVMIFMGVIDASANPNYPAANAGNLYKISVAGKIGGASGPNVEVGDTIYCLTDSTAAGTHAAVGAQWVIAQVNIDGAVTGPASVTDNHEVRFDGTSGKIIKSSGGLPPVIVVPFYVGIPTASVLMCLFAAPAGITTLTFAAAIAGSSGKALAAATAQADFDVRKNATNAANGTSVGTIRFAAAATVPTFIAASGFTLTGGTDWLTVWAPATPDATLADISASLFCTR